jgi:hypothetical protein
MSDFWVGILIAVGFTVPALALASQFYLRRGGWLAVEERVERREIAQARQEYEREEARRRRTELAQKLMAAHHRQPLEAAREAAEIIALEERGAVGAGLSGTVGDRFDGLSDPFSDLAGYHAGRAWRWRTSSVALYMGGAAIGSVLFFLVDLGENLTGNEVALLLAGRVGIVVALGSLGIYAARIASNYQRQEEEYRHIAVTLDSLKLNDENHNEPVLRTMTLYYTSGFPSKPPSNDGESDGSG